MTQATKSRSVTRREEVQIQEVIVITIGENKLELPKEALKARRGIHKAIINTVAPWVRKVLEGCIK